ncbi:MAG: hypothetical protein KDE47_21540 [Caldilineaceae bacterium]|nr:hypothetical protein [Caldilineaceae bacterium]
MTVHLEKVHQQNFMRRWLAPAFTIVRTHRRAYLWLNGLYYGLMLLGMLYTFYDAALQRIVTEAVGAAFSQGPLAAVGEAYVSGQTIRAILLTFVINLFVGSGATITLPSLIIPFSGLLMGAYRAVLWGLIYAPTSPELRMIFLPHLPTLLLEGQAYVLVLLGVVMQGRALFAPRTVDATTRRQAYGRSLKLTWQLYGLVLLVLAVAAIYEVLEAAVLMAWMG